MPTSLNMLPAHTSPVVSTPIPCRAVAIGASAGGIRALQIVLGALPVDFAVPVLIVLHLNRQHESLLANVLRTRTALRVKGAQHDEAIVGGTVYLGVPDVHLQVIADRVVLTSTADVHFSRPSVDVLFRSIAANYGAAACAVILSGAGHDGAEGLAAVKAAGGTTMVQDPVTAGHAGMPLAALATNCVDRTLAIEDIGPALVRMAIASAAGSAS